MAESERMTRRGLLGRSLRGACAVGLGGVAAAVVARGGSTRKVWQIDPYKCTWCGNCATHCVLQPSAVKCVHNYAMCGYCKPCFAYYDMGRTDPLESGAEKQLCPTGAIRRTFVPGSTQAFRYDIDEEKCIGCGECVKGCTENANGSLFLQIRHDRCVNCNECAIAAACPAGAIRRVPADTPYILKSPEKEL